MSSNDLPMNAANSATATFAPTDPLYALQWHFPMIGTLGYSATYNTEGIERIWSEYTGAGVHVGVWDDGVQRTHWDLADNYDDSLQVSVGGTVNDGQPPAGSGDKYAHGTSVAGLIAAQANGLGGVGVAFDAAITAIRIFGGADDVNEHTDRFLQTLDSLGQFDVTNHSYGSDPDFIDYGDAAKHQVAAELGRNGLGTINITAAGNTNWDGNGEYSKETRFTVSVAALEDTPTGNPTFYSTYGAHILVSAPAALVTTDMLGMTDGYNGLLDGDYTNDFGGTSAAAPVTTGVVTLMLDANAGLG
ncbi:MAG: serine peptidase, partial [Burkholderiaceae bacterium]|nr:serine peptidase [Burkholderiaceae bacterium]